MRGSSVGRRAVPVFGSAKVVTALQRLGVFVSGVALASQVAFAHPLSVTQIALTLPTDGTFRVDMTCDLDALALGAPQDSDDAELVAILQGLSPDELAERTQHLRELFVRRVRVRFDGEAAPFEVRFPDHGVPPTGPTERPTLLGLTARLTGTVPTGARSVEFFASRSFADVHLEIVDAARGVSVRSILEPGARSDPFELAGPVRQVGRGQIAWQYLKLGFVHIVPNGADHILFVLGFFLLSPRLRPLLWQVTAFTGRPCRHPRPRDPECHRAVSRHRRATHHTLDRMGRHRERADGTAETVAPPRSSSSSDYSMVLALPGSWQTSDSPTTNACWR